MVEGFSGSFVIFNSREAIAVFIGDIVFFNSSSPSMVLATIDFFNFSDFYCFTVEICVRCVNISAFRSIA